MREGWAIFYCYFLGHEVHGGLHALLRLPQVKFEERGWLAMHDGRHSPCGKHHGPLTPSLCSFSLSGGPHGQYRGRRHGGCHLCIFALFSLFCIIFVRFLRASTSPVKYLKHTQTTNITLKNVVQ